MRNLIRVKSVMKDDEAKALESILLKNPDLTAEMLVAKHTEKQFIWELKEGEETLEPEVSEDYPFGLQTYPMDQFTEAEATADAMLQFKTFESNLKAAHTESEFRFTTVREQK